MVLQHVKPSFVGATSLLCKRWTAQIVYLLLERPHRFSELLGRLEQISDRMLSERLKELEAAGVIVRRVLERAPIGVEYSLTAVGQALRDTLLALEAWGERHLAANAAPARAARKARARSA